jgi:hypothetical protein
MQAYLNLAEVYECREYVENKMRVYNDDVTATPLTDTDALSFP